MFGDAQLNELQVRKTTVLVECANDRLMLREELLRAGSGLANLRSPFGWLRGMQALFTGAGSRDSRQQPGGWDFGSAIQSGLKAYAVYKTIRGFFAKRAASKVQNASGR